MEIKRKHSIYGSILLGFCVALALLMSISHTYGGAVLVKVDVPNTPPIFENIFISKYAYGGSADYPGGITLSAGRDTNVYINGTIRDDNSAEDIHEVGLAFYRSGVNLHDSCVENGRNCYHVQCELTNKDNRSKYYNCSLGLKFYTDATTEESKYSDEEWVVNLISIDQNHERMVHNGKYVEVNSLLAVEYDKEMAFGIMQSGQGTSNSNNQDMIFKQQGNSAAAVYVRGEDLDCTNGKIPYENLSWSLQDVGYDSAQSHSLTKIDRETGLIVSFYDEEVQHQPTLYWNIKIPDEELGACRGYHHIYLYYF